MQLDGLVVARGRKPHEDGETEETAAVLCSGCVVVWHGGVV